MSNRSFVRIRLGSALVATLAPLLFVAACADKNVEPARQAIADVETALSAAGTEPVKYVPGRLGDVVDQVTVLKSRFEAKDYEAVLADAPAALEAARALPAEAAARKAELMATLGEEWTALAATLPAELEAVRLELDRRVKLRKLPAGQSAEMLDAARTGVEDARALWERATAAQASARLEEAMTLGAQAQDRIRGLNAALAIEPAGGQAK